jgi:hypothetical protein
MSQKIEKPTKAFHNAISTATKEKKLRNSHKREHANTPCATQHLAQSSTKHTQEQISNCCEL